MAKQSDFSVAEFFALGNEAAAKTAELRIKMAAAGVVDRDHDEDEIEIESRDRD